MLSTAALLRSAEQQAVSQCSQSIQLLLRAVVFINTTKSSYLKNSLTIDTTYSLAKHKEMRYYLFSLSFVKTKQNL